MILGSYMDTAADELKQAIRNSDFELDYMTNEKALWDFPSTEKAIGLYDVVIFSDIGSDTLLLHPDTTRKSQVTANRLKLLRDYVRNGGGFITIGGYMSFQGYEGKARYHGTPIEEVLPVDISPYDDRVECPEGCRPRIVNPEHPILTGIPDEFPVFLGYNRVRAKQDAEVLAVVNGGDVFIACGRYGKGRCLVFTSDSAPHWATPGFLNWRYYQKFWGQAIEWTGGG